MEHLKSLHFRLETELQGDTVLMTRSQARSITSRLQEYESIDFDFAGVELIGPSFADEIFRVFANEHPQVHLEWENANADVEKMIRRAKAITS